MDYTIIKIKDDVFNGNHPNGIDEGHTMFFENKPKVVVGRRYLVENGKNYLLTSTVTEIILETEKETIFKTANSTYKIITNENN